jgi:NAD(P)-dependent dehydrogenase (short-subunit alcohol dehydrogenase family)
VNAKPLVLVTGAGSGIGRATAVLLGANGWQVAVNGRRLDALQETAETIERAGGCALVRQGDVGVQGFAQSLVQGLIDEVGRFDALVHCAGEVSFVPLDKATVEDLSGFMRVHTDAALAMVSTGWEALCTSTAHGGPGRVVLVSSRAAHDPFPGLGVYGMAKAALEGLVRAIHVDAQGRIEAFAVAPDCVDTPMLHGLLTKEQLEGIDMMPPQAIAKGILERLSGSCPEDRGGVWLP